MTIHSYKMREEAAELINRLASDHASALKNHIASRVERDDFEGAKSLIAELRMTQAVFAAFNIDANRAIAKSTGKPLETSHAVSAN